MPTPRRKRENPAAEALAGLATRRQQALDEALAASGINMASWARELTETARLATAVGEFGPAIKAYELLGKHLGHLTEGAPQQHLHLHGPQASIAALTDAQLRERLATLVAPTPTGDGVVINDPDPFA